MCIRDRSQGACVSAHAHLLAPHSVGVSIKMYANKEFGLFLQSAFYSFLNKNCRGLYESDRYVKVFTLTGI